MARASVTGALLVAAALATARSASAQETPGPTREDEAPREPEPPTVVEPTDDTYRTPLAGQPLRTSILGVRVDVPARDRGEIIALTLGGAYYEPDVGDTRLLPIGALFVYEQNVERRFRGVFSGVVNTVEHAERFGSVEALGHFENETIPFDTTEVIDGRSIEASALRWGSVSGGLGVGWRLRLPPGELDNGLAVQLFYELGWWYFLRAHDTPDAAVVPRSTYVHGLRLRVQLDMIQRNLLELPHLGFAGGADVQATRRDRWRDTGPLLAGGLERQFPSSRTRDFLRLSGYLVGAVGIPGLSERHRVLAYVHAGWAPPRSLDRFSGFRLGGGPLPSEAGDLARAPYQAALFDQFVAQHFALVTLEYRFEVLFFLYLHLRATVAHARLPTYHNTPGPPGPVRFVDRFGDAYGAAVTSGFLWQSQVTIDYTYDTSLVRFRKPGHTVLVTWSKQF